MIVLQKDHSNALTPAIDVSQIYENEINVGQLGNN